MDTGYLEEGETMDDEYDTWKAILPEECLGVINQLLCLEVCNFIHVSGFVAQN